MELLTVNSGKPKRVRFQGREYFVTPLTMIVEGVLNGSEGPLFYSEKEMAKNYDSWNGIPIVKYHPVDENGKAVSARNPTVLEQYEMGRVFNTRVNGSLQALGWFDVERTKQISPSTYEKLEKGIPEELSTGLFTDHIPVKNKRDAVYKGKSYVAEAINYRPDHLAVLPGKVGACSVKDGCGVGVLNESKELENYLDWDEDLEQEKSTTNNTSTTYWFELISEYEPKKQWYELLTDNVFCPTGLGGGVDPTCKRGGKGTGGAAAIAEELVSAPPPGEFLKPDVEKDSNGDGVTDMARVGVPAHVVPPPPQIPKLPNLTPHEREVEENFRKAFHENPDKLASDFRGLVTSTTKPGEAPTFGTDDAKVLASAWGREGMSLEERSQNRATLNLALHQTANGVCKRAFVQHLDTLQPGDEIMVTVGGCGAGKGYALKNVPQALEAKKRASVIWDSAGDQNATENPWILQEAEKRGLKVHYVYVHNDPRKQWADPNMGVVKRAQDPNDGRMVDASVFADSYALGARNHSNFYAAQKNNPNAQFTFLDNSSKPKLIDGIPQDSLTLDRKALAAFARNVVEQREGIPPHVKRGALMGSRVWGDD